MGILAFLVIGLISGWLAGVLTRGGGFGLVGDIIVGIVGALLGGLILGWVGIAAYGTIGSIATAVMGAIIFLWLIRVLRHA